QENGDASLTCEPVESVFHRLRVQHDDPVTASRHDRRNVLADRLELTEQIRADPAHGRNGQPSLEEKPAIGKHQGIGRGTAEETVALNQQHARAHPGGSHSGTDSAGTTACYNDVEMIIANATHHPHPRYGTYSG